MSLFDESKRMDRNQNSIQNQSPSENVLAYIDAPKKYDTND
jgi:hypothetical protein